MGDIGPLIHHFQGNPARTSENIDKNVNISCKRQEVRDDARPDPRLAAGIMAKLKVCHQASVSAAWRLIILSSSRRYFATVSTISNILSRPVGSSRITKKWPTPKSGRFSGEQGTTPA